MTEMESPAPAATGNGALVGNGKLDSATYHNDGNHTSTRRRLPARRAGVTVEIVFDDRKFSVTTGRFPDGAIGEVFARDAKPDSALDQILEDVAVAISLGLQYGVPPAAFAKSMGTRGLGQGRSSIVGAICDVIAENARG
jgi:hypothetical protein